MTGTLQACLATFTTSGFLTDLLGRGTFVGALRIILPIPR